MALTPEVVLAEHDSVLAESWFPSRELSLIIDADRRARDSAYSAHTWWARRPPALLRALLLALTLPGDATETDLWSAFESEAQPLAGLHVYDPFVGGGSTLIEATRLGASVSGGDADPTAVKIVRHVLAPAPATAVRENGKRLLSALSSELGHLYPLGSGATALHYFSVAEVRCTSCGEVGALFRNLVLVRDRQKPGGVVRDHALTVFCPICFQLHHLSGADRKRLSCCGRYHSIAEGTFRKGAYHCPSCGERSSHRDLASGVAPRRLIAVERFRTGARRWLHSPTEDDLHALASASATWAKQREGLPRPLGEFSRSRQDERPRSYGIVRHEQLFTPRQLLVFGTALSWLGKQTLDVGVRDALELAISNALTANNRLCGYATDYGRLSPLFSVRGYSLPALAVELNPLNADGGRGTIAACVERAARAAVPTARRHVWSVEERQPVARLLGFMRPLERPQVVQRNASAITPVADYDSVDIVVFDPPYFDFIVYEELSEIHRAWFGGAIDGPPLLPSAEDPTRSFGALLGRCLHEVLKRLRRGRPLAFTYHSASPDAWRAVAIALDQAQLRVTAVWPVRSDGHMGHHSHPGNCEWDIVLVCRSGAHLTPGELRVTPEDWIDRVTLPVNSADRTSFRLALDMARRRFAAVREHA